MNLFPDSISFIEGELLIKLEKFEFQSSETLNRLLLIYESLEMYEACSLIMEILNKRKNN